MPARIACEKVADGHFLASLTKDVQFAACIGHLVAIGGDTAREYLLSPTCPLNRKQIEGLGRRMPPFIRELQDGDRRPKTENTG